MAEEGAARREWQEHQRVVADAAALVPAVEELSRRLCDRLGRGGKLLAFGNGGSAAEAQHFAGELLGRFRATRQPLAAIALSSDPSVVTGIGNDFGYDDVFARQLRALAVANDVALGITTSGRSANVVIGLQAARERGALAVALTGSDPGPAGEAADLVLAVPSDSTARIQEVHTLIMHSVCVAIDAWAVDREGGG